MKRIAAFLLGAALASHGAQAQALQPIKSRIWEFGGTCGAPNVANQTSDLIAIIKAWSPVPIMIVGASADFIFTEDTETATLFVGNGSWPDPVTPMRWLPARKTRPGDQRQLTSERNFAAGQGMPMTGGYLDIHMPCAPAEAGYGGSLTVSWVEMPAGWAP